MEEEIGESIRPLYIPAKIQRKFQLVEGVGVEQIIKTLIYGSLGIGIDRIMAIFMPNRDIIISVLVVIVCGGIGLTLYKINEYNQSIYSIIKIGMRFNKRQRRYKFAYHDKWR